jgi:hypothetical protein
MIITPCLGIGDLILLKWVSITNNITITTINICTNLIEEHSIEHKTKTKSIVNTINMLFPDIITNKIIGQATNKFILQKNIDCLFIYDYLRPSLFENISNPYTDYIVFHTKVRYDRLIDEYKKFSIPKLNIFFSSFKTDKKIIILGEKNVAYNKECVVHKTFSIYNNIMLLQDNNEIIDLTKNVLVDGNNCFDDFLQDIQIINDALCNVTFGVGGPYLLSLAFSKNNVSFLPFIHKSPHCEVVAKLNKISNSLVDNTDMLFPKINNFISS